MARTLSTVYKTELTTVQTAIADVEAWGSATYKGSSVTSTDLPTLYLRARLFQYRLAEQLVTEGSQSYQVDNRRVTRADLPLIAKMIDQLESQLARLSRGGIRQRLAVPLG